MVKDNRFLGVILDHSLTCAKHVTMLKTRVNRIINAFRGVSGTRSGPSTSLILHLYTAFVKETISFSSPVLH